ncbi:MAG: AAA family ATPase, partial [Chloroflexota bacterium]|nr:AAA family ATPase [Chloroflexota bacterium]
MAESSWGHKYFSLLFPDKLDDFHNAEFQRYQLIRLLQVPPLGKGRYVAAGRFVALTRELGLPMNHLTKVLYGWHGRPRRYWRVGTGEAGALQKDWPATRDGAYVAIGWPALGDLSGITLNQASKDTLHGLVEAAYPDSSQVMGRTTRQLFDFVARTEEGDVILAADGERVLGVGRVVGGYRFDSAHDFPHQRPVEWLSIEAWRMPAPEGVGSMFTQLSPEPSNRVEAERRIFGQHPMPRPVRPTSGGAALGRV